MKKKIKTECVITFFVGRMTVETRVSVVYVVVVFHLLFKNYYSIIVNTVNLK